MTHTDRVLSALFVLVGLAGLVALWLLARRARQRAGQHRAGNRPTWDSPVALGWDGSKSSDVVVVAPGRALVDGQAYGRVVEWSDPAAPTQAERAARAAAIGRHPSTFRPTRSAFEQLAAAVDDALATVAIPRPLEHLGDDTVLLPRADRPAVPPSTSPVIANTEDGQP